MSKFINKVFNEDGWNGSKRAMASDVKFTLQETKGSGKKAYQCYMGNECYNRCSMLTAAVKCELIRGVCIEGCAGFGNKEAKTNVGEAGLQKMYGGEETKTEERCKMHCNEGCNHKSIIEEAEALLLPQHKGLYCIRHETNEKDNTRCTEYCK